ncbi:MAG: tetratricopeptide repeat protein [bacterium]
MRKLRNVLIIVCVLATGPLWWRAQDVFAEVERERRAAALYRQGLSLHLKGQSGEAAVLFRQAIILAPLAAEVYGDLADAEFRQGHVDAAVETYRKLQAIYPYTYFGGFYREVGFIELRAGRNVEARDDLARAVSLDPLDWHAQYLLGHAYKRLGDRASARGAWRRVLDLRPDFQPAHEQIRILGN